jgi:hypothetical protein
MDVFFNTKTFTNYFQIYSKLSYISQFERPHMLKHVSKIFLKFCIGFKV